MLCVCYWCLCNNAYAVVVVLVCLRHWLPLSLPYVGLEVSKHLQIYKWRMADKVWLVYVWDEPYWGALTLVDGRCFGGRCNWPN